MSNQDHVRGRAGATGKITDRLMDFDQPDSRLLESKFGAPQGSIRRSRGLEAQPHPASGFGYEVSVVNTGATKSPSYRLPLCSR